MCFGVNFIFFFGKLGCGLEAILIQCVVFGGKFVSCDIGGKLELTRLFLTF